MLSPIQGQLLLCHILQLFSINRNTSFICPVNTAYNIQKSRFSGTGWSQKHTKLSSFNFQIKSFQNIYPAVACSKRLFDPLNL